MAINDVLKAFDNFSINGEIAIINDGSRDKTKYKIEAYKEKDSHVNLLNYGFHQGVGESF